MHFFFLLFFCLQLDFTVKSNKLEIWKNIPCPHKGRGCPQMTNGSELTSFSIYNFRGQDSQTALGNPACPRGIFSAHCLSSAGSSRLRLPAEGRRVREAVRSPGSPAVHPRHLSLTPAGSGLYRILELELGRGGRCRKLPALWGTGGCVRAAGHGAVAEPLRCRAGLRLSVGAHGPRGVGPGEGRRGDDRRARGS